VRESLGQQQQLICNSSPLRIVSGGGMHVN